MARTMKKGRERNVCRVIRRGRSIDLVSWERVTRNRAAEQCCISAIRDGERTAVGVSLKAAHRKVGFCTVIDIIEDLLSTVEYLVAMLMTIFTNDSSDKEETGIKNIKYFQRFQEEECLCIRFKVNHRDGREALST